MDSSARNPAAHAGKRPLSPHLQVYRWQMTMLMSILHRMTGAGLAVGVLYFIWWLVAAAWGAGAYEIFTGFTASWMGQIMLLGWTACLYYHMANGIRHLIWDCGYLLEIRNAYLGGYAVWLFAMLATGLTWLCVWL